MFMMDSYDELIPNSLNFICDMVGSKDEHSPKKCSSRAKPWKQSTKTLWRKALSSSLSWKKTKRTTRNSIFSKNIKLGIHEDSTSWQWCLSELLGYHTSQSGYEMTFISKYVSSMKTQKSVYYTTTESKDWVANSTFMERMKKWGVEVVYITKPIYRYCIQQSRSYMGKSLVSLIKEGMELPEDEKEKKMK